MPLKDILAVSLGVVAIVWYYICLIAVGKAPMPTDANANQFRGFMSLSITTIGASLATFVGMLMGLQQAADVALVRSGAGNVAAGITTKLQWISAALYVLSLILALWFWYRRGDTIDPAVSNLGKTLLGLLGGALAIVLNLP